MIGGNTQLALQVKTVAQNAIGEGVATWTTIQTLTGWLDYQSGDSQYSAYNAKIQESTHFFIADYVQLDGRIKAEKCRAICNGNTYDVLIIDNPMDKNRQLEIYLKYTGGQDG